MNKVFNYSIDELNKKKKKLLIISLLIFGLTTIAIALLLIFETRKIKVIVEIVGSIVGVIGYFACCYIWFFEIPRIKSNMKDVLIMNTKPTTRILKLTKIEEKPFFLSYNMYLNLTFIDESNLTSTLLLLEKEGKNFTVGSSYKVVSFGDKILEYEEK